MTQHMTKTLSGAALDWAVKFAGYIRLKQGRCPGKDAPLHCYQHALDKMDQQFGAAAPTPLSPYEIEFLMEENRIVLMPMAERWLALPDSLLMREAQPATMPPAPITFINSDFAYDLLANRAQQITLGTWYALFSPALYDWPTGTDAFVYEHDAVQAEDIHTAVKRCFVRMLIGDTIEIPDTIR